MIKKNESKFIFQGVTENENIKINIEISKNLFDGGVYMFKIDGIPLYIGQANIFSTRLNEHLYDLFKDSSHFCLNKLKKEHVLTYEILMDKLPYDKEENIQLDEGKERKKRASDKNEAKRIEKEKQFIKAYEPILQKGSDKILKNAYQKLNEFEESN